MSLPQGLDGQYQKFTGGCIVSSDDFGAVFLTLAICTKYFLLEFDTDDFGVSLMKLVGLPLSDTAPFGTGAVTQFTGGQILSNMGNVCYAVYGNIYGRYLSLATDLGLPLEEEWGDVTGLTRSQRFENGSIYWNGAYGAFAVKDPIRTYWEIQGANLSTLGFPVSDTSNLVDANGTIIGLQQRFSDGVVYHTPSTGTRALPTKLADVYEKEYGGPNGGLGLPIGDLTTSTVSGYQFIDFQDGVLVDTMPGAPPAPGDVILFRGFDFYVDQLETSGDDCAGGFCGTQDPYWYITVWDEAGAVLVDEQWGNADDSSWIPQQAFALPVPKVSGTRSYTVRFHAVDKDLTNTDSLGTTESTYSIDNLWGYSESNDHHTSTDKGGASGTYQFRNYPPIDLTNKWTENFWWSFKNFSTDNLTYQQFAATFADVSNDEAWYAHPFNHFYYDVLFDTSAAAGNCFGMSLESIYAREGRSPYAEPIHQYFPNTQTGSKPIDANGNPLSPAHASLINHLNIKHAYQLGLDSVAWFLGNFLGGTTHDPIANFLVGQAFHESGEPTLVTIFDTDFFQKGHTMRVIDYELFGPSCGPTTTHCHRIYVADPNYPSGLYAPDPPPDEYIEINPADTGQYTYHDYSGGIMVGGRLFIIPYRLLNHQPVTPFGIAQELLSNMAFLVTGSTGRVNQATDEVGRTLFESPVAGSPSWDDLTQDSAQQLPTLVPIPLAMDGPMPGQLYAGMNVVGTDHEYQLGLAPGLTAGTEYEAMVDTARLASRFSVPGTPGIPDIVRTSDIGTETKAIEVQIPAESNAKSIDWTIGAAIKYRWAEFKELAMVPGQRIRMRMANGGYRVIIENDGPDTAAVVRVSGGQGATPLSLGGVDIPSGTSEVDFRLPRSTLSVTGEVLGNGGWLIEPVTITLDAVDYSGAGLAAIEYSLDGESWTTYSGPFAYAEQGETELFYRARDNQGNQESAKSQSFWIDSVHPEAFGAVSTSSGVSLSYTVSDPVPGSGVLGIHTLAQGASGPVEQFVAGTDGSVALPTACSEVEFWAEDTAGNLQLPHAVIQDSVPPTLTAPPVIHTNLCTVAAGLGFGVEASDDCGVASLTSNAPAHLPLGTTVVTWEAADAAGNVTTLSQEITTELTEDPSCCPVGSNIIVGTPNDDQLMGTSGSDCIIAKGGQDKLYGFGGADALSGGDGDDQLWGGTGDDWLFGGTGQDKLYGETDNDHVLCGDGVDQAYGGTGNDFLFGGQGGDNLYGDAGNDTLWGEADDDHMDGGTGNDYLDGGLNHDWCQGGGGTDQCVQDGGDTLSGTCTAVAP